MSRPNPKRALRRAVQMAGGQAALAEKLTQIMGETIEQQHVWNWLHRNKGPLGGKYVIPIEKAIEGRVTRYELGPDLYPREERVS